MVCFQFAACLLCVAPGIRTSKFCSSCRIKYETWKPDMLHLERIMCFLFLEIFISIIHLMFLFLIEFQDFWHIHVPKFPQPNQGPPWANDVPCFLTFKICLLLQLDWRCTIVMNVLNWLWFILLTSKPFLELFPLTLLTIYTNLNQFPLNYC